MPPTSRARITRDLRTAIERGTMPAGTKLDTEEALAAKYGVSRPTVRLALGDLAAAGLIYTLQGRGAFVRDRTPIYRSAADRLSREQRNANQAAHLAEAGAASTVTTRVYYEPADPDTAAALDIPTGEEVLVRDRVMGIGEQQTQLATSRFPRTLTRGTLIEQEDTGPGGVHARLEEAGHTIREHTERVSMHRATETEADALQIPVGSACFRVQRITRSTTGRVLEVNTMTLVDRYVLVYEIPAE